MNPIESVQQTLEKFGTVFGEDSLIPKIFSRDEFKNGSIIDDFLSIVGIPCSDCYEIPSNANESLSLTGITLLRALNKTIPRWIDNKPNPVRANLVSYVQKHFSDSKYVMKSGIYELYDLEFRESNLWVRDKYFPSRSSLFSNHMPCMSTERMSDEEINRIVNFITDMWVDKQKKIIDLRK